MTPTPWQARRRRLGEHGAVDQARSTLLERLTLLRSADRLRLAENLLVHATVCLLNVADGGRRSSAPSGALWAPYLQPTGLPAGWDIEPWLCDVDHIEPGECAESGLLGVPNEPVPRAWCRPGVSFRLLEAGAVIGKGVVLAVHPPPGE